MRSRIVIVWFMFALCCISTAAQSPQAPSVRSTEADTTIVDVPLFGKRKEITYYSAERGLPITERSEHEGWQAMWWNVENLFHPDIDSLNPDREFTPEGMRRWTYSRYRTKVAQIAQVVANAGGWQGIDIVGLCEVEDSACVADICRALGNGYRAVHYDSPDPRGIDVALLYRSTCTLLCSQPIPVRFSDGKPTRDLLYARLVMPQRDTIDILLCHLPSMRGGYSAAARHRKEAQTTIQHTIDSLLLNDPTRQIILMGDMNDDPHDDLRNMHNRMCDMQAKSSEPIKEVRSPCRTTPQPMSNKHAQGTYKYRGIWSYLDQCYLSESLQNRPTELFVYAPDYLLEDDERFLGSQPKRTYIGMRYHGGCSDHLPIVLKMVSKL
ncbi:MAG: endonuclease [Paludibacteraceae bacterium]|nr:endonuclease [Paludibacteraceae bacterium]